MCTVASAWSSRVWTTAPPPSSSIVMPSSPTSRGSRADGDLTCQHSEPKNRSVPGPPAPAPPVPRLSDQALRDELQHMGHAEADAPPVGRRADVDQAARVVGGDHLAAGPAGNGAVGTIDSVIRPHHLPPLRGTPPVVGGPYLDVDCGYHGVVSHQPPDRFWTFQAIEAAIFAVPAALLVAFAIWCVR